MDENKDDGGLPMLFVLLSLFLIFFSLLLLLVLFVAFASFFEVNSVEDALLPLLVLVVMGNDTLIVDSVLEEVTALPAAEVVPVGVPTTVDPCFCGGGILVVALSLGVIELPVLLLFLSGVGTANVDALLKPAVLTEKTDELAVIVLLLVLPRATDCLLLSPFGF
jgi:hypothetical protein